MVDAIKSRCEACSRALYAFLVKGSPPEPCEEVVDLLSEMGMTKKHVLQIYTVFHELRQAEKEEVVKTADSVEFASIYDVVPVRKRWVEPLLKSLLLMGGVESEEEEVHWDYYLYILLRFCSLSKPELCQTLYLMILKHLDSKNIHYITLDQMVQFYSFYAKCPVTSFNTRAIDFTRLPLRRYYVNDFVELVQRFTVLLNPAIHLQRCLQEVLPSSDFWDNYLRSEVLIRKIDMEFFCIDKTRCFLWGEPPFRESCDMLAPEALGFIACNRDQWGLRTFDLHERVGALSDGGSLNRDGTLTAPSGYQYRSLRQFSVWGEQSNPEEIERMMTEMDNDNVYITATGHIHRRGDLKEVEEEEEPETPEEPEGSDAGSDNPDYVPRPKKMSKEEKKKAAAAALEREQSQDPFVRGLDPMAHPADSCLRAACLDESELPPPSDKPPAWMKGAAICPAPRVRGEDPPLSRIQARMGMSTTDAFYKSNGSFPQAQTIGSSPPPMNGSPSRSDGFAKQSKVSFNNSKSQS